MTITFRPAIRENVNLIIALAGGTGSGKTYTAMRLATGIAGGKFAVIDTEAGRAKHYAGQFQFDHADLTAPFTPQRYLEAIVAADEAHYPVILVDSLSHEHAGDGGLLEMHDAELERLGGGANQNMLAWVKPKTEHKKMVSRLLQVRAHLILCFRAEEKIEMVKDDKGKMQIVPKKSLVGLHGWIPICEKNLPYEATVSFLLTADKPGVPKPIKLQEQHKALFPLDQPITEESGRRIQEWASGKGQSPVVNPDEVTNENRVVSAKLVTDTLGASHNCISIDQLTWITDQCNERNISLKALEVAAGVAKVDMIPAAKFERVKAWIERHV